MNKLNKNEKVYKLMMKRNYKELKHISDKEAKSSIEFINTGSTTYDAFLWQQKLVNQMKIYITYLWYIDSLIVNISNLLKSYRVIDEATNKNELNQRYNEIVTKRKAVLKLIEDNTSLNLHLAFTKDVLNEIPSFSKFKLVYDDLKINHYQLKLQIEFINAYNSGFSQNENVREEYMEQIFNQYHSFLTEYCKENEAKIARVKLLKK